jgi:hypothetical protein
LETVTCQWKPAVVSAGYQVLDSAQLLMIQPHLGTRQGGLMKTQDYSYFWRRTKNEIIAERKYYGSPGHPQRQV